jgi:RimJ/RimL family protein N-acetyltransferase
MDIVIRKVLLEEAYEYAVNHIACWRDAYKGIIPDEYLDNMSTQIEQRVERNRQNLSDPGDCEYLCVEYDGSMIGRLVFSKCRDDDKANSNTGEIHAIYLLADYWGKGYGKIMMDYAVAELRNAECVEIVVWVLEDNRRARSFYEKYGFVFDGQSKDIDIGKPLSEIRYALYLE